MKSGTIRMGKWHCYRLMLFHHAPALAWIVAVVVVALTVAGFFFSPWVGFATLGFDFFIIVSALSFVIFAYGFNSVTGVNMPPHTLELEGDNIVAEFEDEKRVEVSRKDILPYIVFSRGVLVPVKGAKSGWLWIPPKAFDDDEAFRAFLKEMYAGRN